MSCVRVVDSTALPGAGGADMLLTLLFALGFLAAPLAPLIARGARHATGWLLALVPASIAALVLYLLRQPQAPAGLQAHWPWLPSLGLDFALRLDGLAALFALLISGVGALIFIYAAGYMKSKADLGRFFGYLTLFLGAMLGIVLADNLLLLYVCWELTTISSWLLIGFEHRDEAARRAAWQALMVTATGGLSMLAGFVLLGQAAGTYEISALVEQADAVRASGFYPAALALVLIGAAAKSALLPLHFWLPNAMVAPTPVSAYLHSAAMVKAGIYLLARLSPLLADTAAWSWSVTILGGATAVVTAWLALMQTDLKRLLAHTTISALGMMTLALGVGGAEAARAAVVLVFAHALYKGALFMVAGAVDHGAGTRDLSALGGLWRAMPVTFAAALLAMLSMVGLPPTLGFIAEEQLVAASQHGDAAPAVLAFVAALVAGTLYTAAGFVAGLRPFLGRQQAEHAPHEVRFSLWAPPAVLGIVGVALAFLPGVLDHHLMQPAAAAIAGHAPSEELKLWHGVTTPFLLGVAMLIAGGGLALVWGRLREAALRLRALGRFGPDRIYTSAVDGLNRGAAALDRILQHGYLPTYLLLIVLTLIALLTPQLLRIDWRLPVGGPHVQIQDAILVAILLLAALGVIFCRTRLAVVVCMSVIGFGVAILFAMFGAPDLALTQVLVEILLTVLIVLLLPLMPAFGQLDSRAVRLRDAVICVGAGVLITSLLLASKAAGTGETISSYYEAHSASRGGGRNIVNTILVNFRAIDTLGEVTVLSAAALGVLTLLPRHRRCGAASSASGNESLLLAWAARVLLPVILVFALFLLLSGHHTPGGGFAAALILAAALALYLFGRPRSGERELVRLHPLVLLAVGLLVMVASGLIGLTQQMPFLAALWLPHKLPVLDGFHLGTPVLFDIGVFIAAAGAIFLLLRNLEEHSPWKF